MPRLEHMVRPTDEEEIAIQAGIAADPDNPEWTDEMFARARPAAEVPNPLSTPKIAAPT